MDLDNFLAARRFTQQTEKRVGVSWMSVCLFISVDSNTAVMLYGEGTMEYKDYFTMQLQTKR